jgi:TP901-1 family phage major tail protein
MPSVAGRKVLLYLVVGTDATLIGALKTKTATINNEPIDSTSDDDNGYRQLIEDVSGTKSVDIKAEGILKDRTTLMEASDGEAALDLRFVVPGVVEISGTFKLASFEVGAEMEDSVTFSATFQSSGQFTIGAVSA